MKRPIFVENQIYHILNRGTDKRKIFINDNDRFRFIHSLFEFNDSNPAANIYYKKDKFQSYEVGLRKIETEKHPRKLLVKILAFCLMSNHFHLLLEQIQEKGITKFMRKLGTGYTNYFNKKYNRDGVLFQGKFKTVIIEEEKHFLHLPYYIHANPLYQIEPKWDKKIISNPKNSITFLNTYRWSSHLDYCGQKNFPSLTDRNLLLKFFGGEKNYQKDFTDWIENINLDYIKSVSLE